MTIIGKQAITAADSLHSAGVIPGSYQQFPHTSFPLGGVLTTRTRDEGSLIFHLEESINVHALKGIRVVVRCTFVARHGYAQFRLLYLIVIVAEPLNEAPCLVRIIGISRCCPAYTVIDGAALSSIYLTIAVDILVWEQSPSVIGIVFTGVKCVDVPPFLSIIVPIILYSTEEIQS